MGYDDEWDDSEPCHHECDENCEDMHGYSQCEHQHCGGCGGCECPGYCDDYQTYNLRPAETGGTDPEDPRAVPAAPGTRP